MGLFDFLKPKKQADTGAASNKPPQPESKPVESPKEYDYSPNADVMPIEERIKTIKPLPCGLYPHEVLLLDYAPKYHPSGDDYPGFWWYNYGIKDVSKELTSLEERGFIKDGGVASAIRNAKVAELKDLLKEQGLKSTGKKDELVTRTLEEINEETLVKHFPNSTYALTEKGDSALQDNLAIPYVHKHNIDLLDIWNVTSIVKESSSPYFRDAIWGHFNKINLEYAAQGQYGLSRNTYLQMAHFLGEEDRYLDALKKLFEVVLWDLSGIGNGETPEMYLTVTANYLFPYEDSLATIPPGITDLLQKYQNKAELDDDAFKLSLSEYINKGVERLPISVFTPEEYVEIVMLEREKNKAALSKIYNKAKKRFEAKYKAKLS